MVEKQCEGDEVFGQELDGQDVGAVKGRHLGQLLPVLGMCAEVSLVYVFFRQKIGYLWQGEAARESVRRAVTGFRERLQGLKLLTPKTNAMLRKVLAKLNLLERKSRT